METNKDATLQSSSSVHAMETRSKTKYQKESKKCSPNNDSAASTKQLMTLHPQEMKSLSFKKSLSDDDDQSSIVLKHTSIRSLKSARPVANLQKKVNIHPNLPVQQRLLALKV